METLYQIVKFGYLAVIVISPVPITWCLCRVMLPFAVSERKRS